MVRAAESRVNQRPKDKAGLAAFAVRAAWSRRLAAISGDVEGCPAVGNAGDRVGGAVRIFVEAVPVSSEDADKVVVVRRLRIAIDQGIHQVCFDCTAAPWEIFD